MGERRNGGVGRMDFRDESRGEGVGKIREGRGFVVFILSKFGVELTIVF